MKKRGGFACCGIALLPGLLHGESVENAVLKLEVSPGNGSIVRLSDKRSKTEYVADVKLARLFELQIPDAADSSRRIASWTQRDAIISVQGTRLSIHYPQLQPKEERYSFGSGSLRVAEPTLAIDVQVTLSLQGDHIEASLSLTNRSLTTITGVVFPAIGGLSNAPLAPPAVVVPSMGQRVYTNTLGALSGRKALRYPAMMASSWVNYEIRARDAAPQSLGVEVRSGLDAQDAYFSLSPEPFYKGSAYAASDEHPFISWVHYPHIAAHGEWKSPPTVIHIHGSDWHSMAAEHREWYRASAHPQRSRMSVASSGLATYLLKDDDNNVAWTYPQLANLAAAAGKAGLHHLVVDGWREREGPANPAPFGEVADERLGGAAALRKVIDDLQRRGIELLFAFHPTLINVTGGTIPPEIGLWGAKTRRGGNQLPVDLLYHTFDVPQSLDFASYRVEIDPASPGTAALLKTAQRLKDEYGFRNLLLKGVGQQAFVSYNAQHGVAPQRAYAKGFADLLTGLRRIYRDGLLVAEGANDLVDPLSDGAYTWDQSRDANVLAYALPWQAFTQDVEALDYASANLAFAHGLLPNLIVDGGTSSIERYGEFAAHLRRLGELRSAAAAYYRDAEFRDQEGLTDIHNDPEVQARAFSNEQDRKTGIVIANTGAKPARASFGLRSRRAVLRARRFPAGAPDVDVTRPISLVLAPHEVIVLALDELLEH